MQEVVVSQSRQRESPPTSWPMGTMGMGAPSSAKQLRRTQAFDRGLFDEATETEVEERAQLDELLHAHLALPVQDVPEPLSVYADATCELGYAYPAIPSQVLNMLGDCPLVNKRVVCWIRHDGIA